MTRRIGLALLIAMGWASTASAQIIAPQYQAVDALNECVTWTLPSGAYSVTAQVTGTFSGTVTFRGTSDGQTYFDVSLTNLNTLAISTTTTTTGQYAIANAGLVKVRACMTSYASGGANISLTRGYGMARGTGFSSVTVNPGPITVTSDSLGTTSFRGFILQNTTAAAAGAQQYSPMLCQSGFGWKTDATAASQKTEYCWEVQPVQGTSAPTANMVLKRAINGGAFTTVATWTSGGVLTTSGFNASTGDFTTTGGGAFIDSTRGVFSFSANGALTIRNSASSASLQMQTDGVPTCSSNCGTSPSVTGVDSAMTVTMGATGVPASGWVVTFSSTSAWDAAPTCVVQPALTGMVVGKLPLTVVTTTTTITVTTNGTAPSNSDKYHILCFRGA